MEQAKIFLEKIDESIEVLTAISPDKALDILDGNSVDAIVSDYQMPDTDGLEFLRELRVWRGNDIPFIMFTGKGREEVAMEALNLGADRYLQKGGSPKDQYGVLVQAVIQEIEHYKTNKALEISEERYKSITEDVMEHSDVAMFILDSNFDIVWINKAAEEYFGLNRDEVIGRNKKELIREKIKHIFEDPDRYEDNVISTFEENDSTDEFECHILENEEKGLDERWLSHWSKPIETGLYEGGRMEHFTDITDVKRSEREKEKHLYDLGERFKELSCLYSLEKIIRENEDIDEVLSQAVDLIPPSWQYPEITTGRIIYKDREFETEYFTETDWMLEAHIVEDEEKVGEVEVSYLEERPEEDEGPFLKEEVDLINSIANHIESFIEMTKAEEKLKESEKRYRNLFDETPIGIWEGDYSEAKRYVDELKEEGIEDIEEYFRNNLEEAKKCGNLIKIKRVNQQLLDMYGVETKEEFIENQNKFLPEDSLGGTIEELVTIAEGENEYTGEIINKDIDGNEMNVFITWSVSEGYKEDYSRVIISTRDITKRKRAEDELKSERNFLEQIAETSPVCITKVDVDGKIVYANDRAEDVLGLSRSDIEGRTYDDVKWKITDFDGDPFPKDKLAFEQVKEKEENVYDVRHAIEWPDGQRKLLSINAAPLFDENGDFDGMVATIDDITEDVEKEKELKKKNWAIETSMNGIAISDLDGTVTYGNKSLLEMWGFDSKEEITGKNAVEFFHDKERAGNAITELIKEGEWKGELKAEREDGNTFDVLLSAHLIIEEDDKKTGIFASILDISERKRKEQEKKKIKESLQEAVTRFRKISEISPNAIILVNRDTGVIKDVNRAAETLFGCERTEIIGRDFLDFYPENEKEYIKRVFEIEHSDKLEFSEEFHVINLENERIPVEMRTSSLELGDKEIVYFALNDISERKEVEEREEFLHSLLRHDLKNKIQITRGYLQLVEDGDLSEEQRKYLEKALNSYEEGIEIIEKVRNLRKLGQEELRDVHIASLLDKIVQECRTEGEDEGIQIDIDFDDLDAKVKGGELLPEVFTNLITNAIKHSEGENIELSVEERDEEVICIIEDDGEGVPSNEKEEIFEKGYSTKKSSSGLGLFLVREIVKEYGGSIEFKDSELGGARFDVHLKKV